MTSGPYDVILKKFQKNRFSSLDGVMNILFEPNLLFRNQHRNQQRNQQKKFEIHRNLKIVTVSLKTETCNSTKMKQA